MELTNTLPSIVPSVEVQAVLEDVPSTLVNNHIVSAPVPVSDVAAAGISVELTTGLISDLFETTQDNEQNDNDNNGRYVLCVCVCVYVCVCVCVMCVMCV